MKRALAKALTWRLLGTGTTALIALLVTGRLDLAGLVGLLDASVKFVLYVIHEKLWEAR